MKKDAITEYINVVWWLHPKSL